MRHADQARAWPWKCLLGLLMLAAPTAQVTAHESRPLYIELREMDAQSYQLQWKAPPSLPSSNTPTVELPESCKEQGLLAEFHGPDGFVRRIRYECSQGLASKAIAIKYPGPNPSISSLIRYDTLSGERHLALLSPQERQWTVPNTASTAGVALQYTRLGIEHIWIGIDHLLFLVCLLWIAGTWQRMLVTVTGFTLAHSATLVLSALQVVRVPIPPVEAAIALSIVFLATEIVKGPRGSLTWRYPIAVSSSFGLLHGFGFAAALSEIGLPKTDLVTGLLFFNVGVEIGQVLFVLLVIGAALLIKRFIRGMWPIRTRQIEWARMTAGYIVGALATFWLIERTIVS